MKKLFFELIALFVFIAVTVMLVEFAFRNYITGADAVMLRFEERKNTAKILFIGNSHIIPLTAASDSINELPAASLAYGGLDLFWSTTLLQKYVASMNDLQTIIVGVDEYWMGYNQTVFKQEYANRAFYKYTDTLYHLTLTTSLLAKSNFFRANRDLSYLFSGQTDNSTILGTIPVSDTASCRQRAREFSIVRFDKNLLEENKILLQKLISSAQQNHKSILFFIPPKRRCFEEQVDVRAKFAGRKAIDQVLNQNNLSLFDANQLHLPDTMFRDPDHLTLQGSEYLLMVLNQNRLELSENFIFRRKK